MKERLQMLNTGTDLSLRCQCDLVGVSRSSFYYQPLDESEQNLGIMRLMGLMAIFPKKNPSKLGLKKYVQPYLLKGLDINRPNRVWTDFVESNGIKISMDGKGRAIDNVFIQ